MAGRLFAFLVVFTLTATAGAQEPDLRPTLPELAVRVAPNPVLLGRNFEMIPPSLGKMVQAADLIVLGTVGTGKTYLSADQRDLYTDYLVTPRRVLAQRIPAQSSPRAAAAPIIVKRWGGQIVLNGVSVTQEEHDLRTFQSGDDLLLLLMYDKTDGKYRLYGGISGAFSVSNGRVVSLLKNYTIPDVRDATTAQIESEVRRLRPNN